MRRIVPIILTLLALIASCGKSAEERVSASCADSLNSQSYRWRYRSLDSAGRCAREALRLATQAGYADGRTEALCHLGFVELMRMDYGAAHSRLLQVRQSSRNELLKLMADVQLMRICQRRSQNKDFYDYMESAQQRMRRLEGQELSDRQRRIWNYCRSDFRLTLYTYYYYLRKEEDARAQLAALYGSRETLEADTAQLAYLCFLAGNQRDMGEGLKGEETIGLMRGLFLSGRHGYDYIGAKCMTSIAVDLLHKERPRASQLVFLREMLQVPDNVDDASLSFWLCRKALRMQEAYGSAFDVSQTHLALARCYRLHGQPRQELGEALLALDGVNAHHRRMTQARGDTSALRPYEARPDTLCRELLWIRDPLAESVPEWMADVREALCMAYSDMGLKYESDYNRNVYLDILDATRQDRRMEQRMDEIAREEGALDRTMLTALLALLLLAPLLAWGIRRIRRSYEGKSAREKAEVEREMARWLAHSDADFASLEERRQEGEEEMAAKEMQLDEQKRRYIDKATSLSIVHAVMPFLDRALNESRKLGREADARPRLRYIGELTDRICLLNEVLTRWIRVRQGAVNLRVESFALQPLLDIVAKSVPLFQQHGIALRVAPSDAVVKADRALTLFMMNTLMDNARKFTPAGGQVSLTATQADGYVEISVTDTGCGLSEADVSLLNGSRVCDTSRIGADAPGNPHMDADQHPHEGIDEHPHEGIDQHPHEGIDHAPQGRKGYGFGLMNCKGIIDKYRKTNPRLFGACLFGVESRRGKGSRFFFRLPPGRLRALSPALAVLCATLLSLLPRPLHAQPFRTITDSIQADPQTLPQDHRLDRAAAYADSVYFANVEGRHAEALAFADTAFACLNEYYTSLTGDTESQMRIYDPDSMSEIGWWRRGVPTDFHLIIDLRNEAAIAALALRQWDTYEYNNEVYTRLYKLMAQDTRLGDYVSGLHHTAQARHTAYIVLVALLFLALAAFTSYYYRHHVLTTFTMRQILELSRRIFEQPDDTHLADLLCEGMNDIHRTDGVALLRQAGHATYSRGCPHRQALAERMTQALRTGTQAEATPPADPRIRLYPLTTKDGQDFGIMALVLHDTPPNANEESLFRLIAGYTATNIYYSSVRVERLRTDIQLTADEQRRVGAEANSVHVQSMVLDNTLSAIKHETMYYPSRIRQLVSSMLDDDGKGRAIPSPAAKQPEDAQSRYDTLTELLSYYKEVFTLLTTCADRQLRHTPLRRSAIPAAELAILAQDAFGQANRHHHRPYPLLVSATPEATVWADRTMARYLMENLIGYLLSLPDGRNLRLDFATSGEMLKFAFALEGSTLTATQLHDLFNPESLRYEEQTDTLRGAELLLARQIIREHDEHVRRGLRIYAEPLQEDRAGIRLVCTLPLKRR